MKVALEDIVIRNKLVPGDLGYVIYLHGSLYGREYGYGIQFETYVALGMHEFYKGYDPEKDRVWICEHTGRIIGFLLLMHRENNSAQLRYFLIRPEYRGIGLGKHLMQLFMDFFGERNYQTAFLWTTNELIVAASLYTRHGFVITAERQSTTFGKPLREQRYDLVPEIFRKTSFFRKS
jgi:ribosomal protein S18 acetylase RimI-like enzyme